MDELKAEESPLLVVDGGNMLFTSYNLAPAIIDQLKRRAELLIELQKKIGIQAVNVGVNDLAAGLKFLEKANADGFPLVSANLQRADGKPSTIPAFRIVEVAGLKVGIFGIVLPRNEFTSANRPPADFKVLDYTEAAAAAVKELEEKKVDLIVALSCIGFQNNKILAEKVKGINLIVSGFDSRMLQSPERVDDTLIFQGMDKGMYLGVAKVTFIPGDLSFIDANEREQVSNSIALIDAQTRIFMGSVAQAPEVQAELARIARRREEAMKRVDELINPSSRVENKLIPLARDIEGRKDIEEVIEKYKANEKKAGPPQPPPNHNP